MNDAFWAGRFYSDAMYAQYCIVMHNSLLGLLGTDIQPLSIMSVGT